MHKLLDTVALTQDQLEVGLKRGDVGAVVELLGQNTYEVEFVTASGHTQAVISLEENEVRALGGRDLISVRTLAEFEA